MLSSETIACLTLVIVLGAPYSAEAQHSSSSAGGPRTAALSIGASFLDNLPASENPTLGPAQTTFAIENRLRAESDRSLVSYIANGIIVGAVLGAVGGVIVARQSADSDLPVGPGITVALTTLGGAVVGGIGGAFVYLMASSSDK